jgi:hypothetical protein
MRAVNPYAVMNAAKRKAAEARDRAREPVLAYYVVTRELLERITSTTGAWVDLASAADVAGCVITRVQKREVGTLHVPEGSAAVYEGRAGAIFVARQNW